MVLFGAAVIAGCMVFGLSGALLAGEYYRLQDERGGVVYTDRMPPEKVRDGHAVLDPHGREVRRLPAEATPAEREAMQREQMRRAEQERTARKQAEHDAMLLSLYASEASIREAREARVGGLQSRHEILGRQLAGQRERLGMLERQYPGHEEIPGLRLRIEQGERSIERLLKDLRRTAESFDADLERWRVLKSVPRRSPQALLSP